MLSDHTNLSSLIKLLLWLQIIFSAESIQEVTSNYDIAANRSIDMVYLSGGLTTIGTDKVIVVSDSEGPSQKIYLSPFYMDKYEVSNEKFREFIQASKYQTQVSN